MITYEETLCMKYLQPKKFYRLCCGCYGLQLFLHSLLMNSAPVRSSRNVARATVPVKMESLWQRGKPLYFIQLFY